MAAQSFAMGEAFGKGFQSGKRRVSSMTNEQFNSKTQAQLFEETTADISAMIPSMKKQMSEFTLLQSDIIKELIGYIKKLPGDIAEGLDIQGLLEGLSNLGKSSGSTDTAHLTLANQLGQIREARYTPSHDRAGDLEQTNAAMAAIAAELTKAYEFAASMTNPKVRTTSPPESVKTYDNKPNNMGILEWTLLQSKQKGSSPAVSAGTASIAAHQESLKIFTKIRAPSSIKNQVIKYEEERRYHENQQRILRRNSNRTASLNSKLTHHESEIRRLTKLINALYAKYNFAL